MSQANKIEKIIEELFRRENDYADAAKDYAEKEAAYRLSKAEAYLLAEGTIAEREAIAAKKVWDRHRAKLAAEAVLSITKERLLDCRAGLSARQSILSAEIKVYQATKDITA